GHDAAIGGTEDAQPSPLVQDRRGVAWVERGTTPRHRRDGLDDLREVGREAKMTGDAAFDQADEALGPRVVREHDHLGTGRTDRAEELLQRAVVELGAGDE